MGRKVASAASLPELNAKADAKTNGQAGIADGRDVLVVGQILGLSVDAEPIQELVTASEVDPCEAEVEIAVREQQAVAAVLVFVFKKGRIVASAGKRRGQDGRDLALRVACGEKAGVRRPPEWARAPQRRVRADGNAIVGGREAAEIGLVVAVEAALDDCVEVGVTAAEEDVAADAAFDGGFDALRAKGLSVDAKAVVLGVVIAERGFERQFLRR